MKLDEVNINKAGEVVISVKTGSNTTRFLNMPRDVAEEVLKELTNVLNQSKKVEFNYSFEG